MAINYLNTVRIKETQVYIQTQNHSQTIGTTDEHKQHIPLN